MSTKRRKSTPNQVYLNKTLIPKCQLLSRKAGIKGIQFQKYLEYTYEIIRQNTESELEKLYAIVEDNIRDLRGYIVRMYPHSRTLATSEEAFGSETLDTLPQAQQDYVKSLYIYKGLSEHSMQDNAKWFNILKALAVYCINKEIPIDDVTRTFGDMTPEEINAVITMPEDLEGHAKARKRMDNSWIKPEMERAKKMLGLKKGACKEWNAVLLKIIWYCKKCGKDTEKFLASVAESDRSPKAYYEQLERDKETAAKC